MITLPPIASRLLASVPVSENINLISQNPDHVGLSNLFISDIFSTIINILLAGSGIIAFIFLLWGGFQWITSGGDKEALDKARRKITNSLVGLALVFGTYAMIFMVSALFGIEIIRLPIQRIGTAIAPAVPGGLPGGTGCPAVGGGTVPAGTCSPGPCGAGGTMSTCFCNASGAWSERVPCP